APSISIAMRTSSGASAGAGGGFGMRLASLDSLAFVQALSARASKASKRRYVARLIVSSFASFPPARFGAARARSHHHRRVVEARVGVVFLVGQELVARSGREDAPAIDEDDAVGERARLVAVMRDVNGR